MVNTENLHMSGTLLWYENAYEADLSHWILPCKKKMAYHQKTSSLGRVNQRSYVPDLITVTLADLFERKP